MTAPASTPGAARPPGVTPAPTRQVGAGRSPRKPRPQLATEAEYTKTILDAARILGWRTAHFRPARTVHGWRTAVQGDAKGWPDLVLVHPDAGHVWFVELKRDDAPKLRHEQDMWRLWLIAAGAIHHVLRVPSGLNSFLATLADCAHHPRIETRS